MSGIRVTSYQGVDPRRFIAGFLAGISIVLFLLLIFALLVFTGGFLGDAQRCLFPDKERTLILELTPPVA